MRRRDFFCRCDVGTRFTILALACVTAGATPGCKFDDFTRISQKSDPACTRPWLVGDAGTPVAYWTFNYGADSADATWLDAQQTRTLVPESDNGDSPPTFSQTRLNGEGKAIALDGHQYAVYRGQVGDPLFPDELTISAWLTLPFGGISASEIPTIWPIVSTLGDADPCGGYQLDLRIDDDATGLELVFSYQEAQAGDAGEKCAPHRLAYPIDNSPWVWGVGRWHHVAASLAHAGSEQSTLALYWDGVRLNANAGTVSSGRLSYSDFELYVGTNQAGAAALAPKFQGTIDELAIFDQVLDDTAVRDFAFAHISGPGPSNCRWTLSERWDDGKQSDAGSLASWSTDSKTDALEANIQDSDWGAGVISAHLEPSRDLSDYSTVHLRASSPNHYSSPNGMFEYSILHGLDYCTWILPAGADSYDLSLAAPSHCASSSCQFPISSVDGLRVATDWKNFGTETLPVTVSGVDFGRDGEPIDPGTYGGAIGPNGWCWRPLAYELGALARFEGSPSADGITATLSGNPSSSARIAADFGSRVLDLSACQRAIITWTKIKSDATTYYTFGLQDIHGAWKNWDIISNEVGITEQDRISASSEDNRGSPEYTNFDCFDPKRVNQISIQKPWSWGGAVTIAVTKLQFEPQGCEHWGTPSDPNPSRPPCLH